MTNNSINKKLAEILGRMDEKVLQAKLNAAMEMLKNGETDELAKKINKMDKNELLSKLNELDEEKLKELRINKEELKRQISYSDLEQIQTLIGEHGDEIIKKIKEILG